MCKLAYDCEKEARGQDLCDSWMEAEEKCRQALDGCERVLGTGHPTTLGMANFPTRLSASQDQLGEGAVRHRQEPDGRKETLRLDLPDVLDNFTKVF